MKTACLNRSAGLISRSFRRHSDENSVEFKVFETVNFNLNEEACGDRPHHSVIQPSLTVTVTVK